LVLREFSPRDVDAIARGQITMLARQVGHPLPQKAMFGMWEWGSRGSSD
jgi:hypothetical protein